MQGKQVPTATVDAQAKNFFSKGFKSLKGILVAQKDKSGGLGDLEEREHLYP